MATARVMPSIVVSLFLIIGLQYTILIYPNNKSSTDSIKSMSKAVELLIFNNINGNGPLKLKHEIPHLLTGEAGQPLVVDHLLGKKRNGFYVEAGAADGQILTNTFFFESQRNWTGLLVEANPLYYHELFNTNRKAAMINCCLATRNSHQRMEFHLSKVQSGMTGASHMRESHAKNPKVLADCFPLHVILAAMKRTKIDLFSLDVEGAELPILRTIPFNKIDIGIVLIEICHIGDIDKRDSLMDLFQILDTAGFQFLGTVNKDAIFGNRKWNLKGLQGISPSQFGTYIHDIQQNFSFSPMNYKADEISKILENIG